jgi:hypothetical protein
LADPSNLDVPDVLAGHYRSPSESPMVCRINVARSFRA